MSDKVLLGSGYIYVAEYTGSAIPNDETLETEANQLGYTNGGATLTYENEYTEIEDDNGQIKENFLSSDNVNLSFGAFVGKPEDILRICPTAKDITPEGTTDKTVIALGGVGNDNNKKYVVRFKHKSGSVRATIIGKNTEGFELSFSKEDPIGIEPTFTASAMDSTGVLAKIEWVK